MDKLLNDCVAEVTGLGAERVLEHIDKSAEITIDLEELGDKECGDAHRDAIDGKRRCSCQFNSKKEWHLCLNFGHFLALPLVLLWSTDKKELKGIKKRLTKMLPQIRKSVKREALKQYKKDCRIDYTNAVGRFKD